MKLLRFTCLLIASLLLFQVAFACTPGPPMTFCRAYDSSFAVVGGTVKTVKYLGQHQVLLVFVENSYKGNLSGTIELFDGGATSCDRDWKNFVGEKMLFYIRQIDGRLYASSTGRTDKVSETKFDIEWLSSYSQSGRRTMIAGRVTDKGYGTGNPIGTTRVVIKSKSKSFTTITDAAGFYRFWDMPTGDYEVALILPQSEYGFQASGTNTFISSLWVVGKPFRMSVRINENDDRCGEMNFSVPTITKPVN